MDKMERELQAQQLNCIIGQLNLLIAEHAENHSMHLPALRTVDKLADLGHELSDLTSKIYGEEE